MTTKGCDLRRGHVDPLVKTFTRMGRRDASAGFNQAEAEARYDEIDEHMVAEARERHSEYVDTVTALDDKVLEIESWLAAPPPPSVGAASARNHADRCRQEKVLQALLAKRDGAHRQFLDDVQSVQQRARTLAGAYWASHGEHRRHGEGALAKPRDFEVQDVHLAPVPPLTS